LSQVSVPIIIDADAIYAISKKPGIISGKPCLITPHSYEFFILTGREVANLSDEEKTKIVQGEAARLKTTILLKGKTDIISDGREVALSSFGSPTMTVGGTGDVLAGIAGALMARGINPFETGQSAALINGLAGERAAKILGESAMAIDLVEAIPEVLKKV